MSKGSSHAFRKGGSGSKRNSFATVRLFAYLISIIAAFLIGCLFLGPWLSRTQALEPESTPPHLTQHLSPSKPTVSHRPHESREPVVRITLLNTTHIPAAGTDQSADSSPPASDISLQTGVQAADPMDEAAQTIPAEAASVDTSSSLYRVRAGVFSDIGHADTFSAQLIAAGYTPTVYPFQRDGKAFYSVQVGVFKSRANADMLVSKLQDQGFSAFVSTDD